MALTKYGEVDKIAERSRKSKIVWTWIGLLAIVCDRIPFPHQMIVESQCKGNFTLYKLAIIEQVQLYS